MNDAQPLLRVERLSKQYALKGGWWKSRSVVHALHDVSLTLERGQTVAVVGESGCGKSTLAKCILGLVDRTQGKVFLDGVEFGDRRGRIAADLRRQVQVVFQDPYASLNPRRTIEQTVTDPLVEAGWRDSKQTQERVLQTLLTVGLGP